MALTAPETQLAFQEACKVGDLARVQELLALEGPLRIDVHAEGEAAFGNACKNGHAPVVRRLLELEGDRVIHVHEKCCLTYACHRGHVRVVALLLALTGPRAYDAEAVQAGFEAACSFGRTEVARLLLQVRGGRAVNVSDPFFLLMASENGYVELVRLLLSLSGARGNFKQRDRAWAFRAACLQGRLEVAQLFLDTHPRWLLCRPYTSEGLLGAACREGYPDMVRLLLSRLPDISDAKVGALCADGCRGDRLAVACTLLQARRFRGRDVAAWTGDLPGPQRARVLAAHQSSQWAVRRAACLARAARRRAARARRSTRLSAGACQGPPSA